MAGVPRAPAGVAPSPSGDRGRASRRELRQNGGAAPRPRSTPRTPAQGAIPGTHTQEDRTAGGRRGLPAGAAAHLLQPHLGHRAPRRGGGEAGAGRPGPGDGSRAWRLLTPQIPLQSLGKGTSRDAGERRILPQRTRRSPQPLERASESSAAAPECEPLLTVPGRPQPRSPARRDRLLLVAAQPLPPPPPPPPPPPSAPAPPAGPPGWLAPSFALLRMTMIFFNELYGR